MHHRTTLPLPEILRLHECKPVTANNQKPVTGMTAPGNHAASRWVASLLPVRRIKLADRSGQLRVDQAECATPFIQTDLDVLLDILHARLPIAHDRLARQFRE